MIPEQIADAGAADGALASGRLGAAAQRLAAPLAALARAMLAYLFIVEGVEKIGNYQAVVGYMQAAGVDGRFLPLVILTELGGGLCILFGVATRSAAFALAGFCVLTAIVFHRGADEAIQFEKNLAIAGGFLALASAGPGPWSIDAWIARRRRPGGRAAAPLRPNSARTGQ